MKSGGFQVSPSGLLGAYSFVRWKPESAEGLTERKQIRIFVLGTSWGLRGQCSKRAKVLRLSSKPLVTSGATELCLEDSMVGQPHPKEVDIHLHYLPAAQCLMPDRPVFPHWSFKTMLGITLVISMNSTLQLLILVIIT